MSAEFRPDAVSVSSAASPQSAIAAVDITDKFGTAEMPIRQQHDAERIFGYDNGALRVSPPIEPGWGRHCIAYGPIAREAGIAFAVYMLNGHNTAQSENLPESFRERLDRWLLGSGTYDRRQRLKQWWGCGRQRRTLRLFRWWWRLRKSRSLPRIDENLAVGWFPQSTPRDPVANGNAFLMHATGADNGELWISSSGTAAPVLNGVRNVPLYMVVVLRKRGAAYYVASTPSTEDLPGHGWLRPMGIDAMDAESKMYAVISQSTLGQIGFRIDSRIYGIHIKRLEDFSQWYGSAHAADDFPRDAALDQSLAQIGGRWQVVQGTFVCLARACVAQAPNSLAILRPSEPTGLLHAFVYFSADGSDAGLVWRFYDRQNFVQLDLNPERCILNECRDGSLFEIARSGVLSLEADAPAAVQILDSGREIRCLIEGRAVLQVEVTALRDEGLGVGLISSASGHPARISSFEAHPRRVALPEQLDLGTIRLPEGSRIAARESFDGPQRELAGKQLSSSPLRWERLLGRGVIEITGKGTARVRASAKSPNPGRTAFVFPWHDAQFADLELTATLPGTERGQREMARIGFILWQDADNYITVNTWNSDGYDGGSISSFFHIDGFEDLYDAVWVNVGRKLWWGRKIKLRLRFDGSQYLAELDGQPVLYRKVSDVYPSCERLNINKVGIVVNWEWGDDTGTTVHEFIVRDHPV